MPGVEELHAVRLSAPRLGSSKTLSPGQLSNLKALAMRQDALPEFQLWLSSLNEQERPLCKASRADLQAWLLPTEDDAAFGLLLTDLVVTEGYSQSIL